MLLTVRHEKLGALMDRLDRVKKLFKENDWDLDYKVVSTYFKDVRHGTDFNKEAGDYKWNTYRVMVDDIDISGDLENKSWRIVGIAERQKNGEVTIDTLDDTIDVPKEFYGSQIRCDHCHTNRRRDQGVIVYNKDTSEFKMVGSACLTDYTGLSMEDLESLFGLRDVTNDGSGKLVSTHYTIDKYLFNVEELLCYYMAVIEKARAGWEEPCLYPIRDYVANDVTTYLFALHCPTGPVGANKSIVLKGLQYGKSYLNDVKPTDYVEDVRKIRDWAENVLDPESGLKTEDYGAGGFEFLSNLKTLAHQDYVKENGAKSLLNLMRLYYYNVTDKEAREERERKILARREEIARKRAEEDARRQAELEKRLELEKDLVGKDIDIDIEWAHVGELRKGAYGDYVIVDFGDKNGTKYYSFVDPKKYNYDLDDLGLATHVKGKVKGSNTYKGETKFQVSLPKFSGIK